MKSLSADNFKIDYLANHPQHIATLASWHQAQWHDISPHLNLAKRISLLSGHSARADIPLTLIALHEQRVLGSASLLEEDMEDRPQYSPWLASVFVNPEYRNQGLATALITAILLQAKSMGLTEIYLFTPDQTEFYAKRGWQRIEQRHYHGVMVDIMMHRIHQ